MVGKGVRVGEVGVFGLGRDSIFYLDRFELGFGMGIGLGFGLIFWGFDFYFLCYHGCSNCLCLLWSNLTNCIICLSGAKTLLCLFRSLI